jgi:DNA (cytosine-5)-methyltransferase 1
MKQITFASLFGGGRLADIGAIQAGCELLWDVEIDPKIAEVGNQLPGATHVKSILDIDWQKLPRPDILWASPPCPNFSIAKTGAKETELDVAIAKATLEAVQILQPSGFILENVEGYKRSQSLQLIINGLYTLSYWVDWQILNAADFGVPQTRRRLILRALKGSFSQPLPFPQKWKGWYEEIADLIPTLPESQLAQWQIDSLPQGGTSVGMIDGGDPAFTVTTNAVGRTRALLISGCACDYGGSSESKNVAIRSQAEPALTVTKSASRQATKAWLESGLVVQITPRALARFQTVPDSYRLPDSNRLACTVIGNGVPCEMARQIILGMTEVLE